MTCIYCGAREMSAMTSAEHRSSGPPAFQEATFWCGTTVRYERGRYIRSSRGTQCIKDYPLEVPPGGT